MALVYLVRNRVNGHRYIGVTVRSLAKRENETYSAATRGESHPLYDAIREYKIDSFTWFIVAEVETKAEALQMERELTRILKPEYNLIYGGGGRAHYIHKKAEEKPIKEYIARKVLPLPAVEEWRPVPGFEGYYEVSSHARVRSLTVERSLGRSYFSRVRTGKILKQKVDARDNRWSITLARHKVYKTYRISTLVALVFIGPRPDGMEVCHLSDDKSDNKINNLYYGTHIQNCEDRSRNGKTMRGAKATGVILTEEQVREIKRSLAIPGAFLYRELAEQYGVTREAIGAIARGRTWGHVRIGGDGDAVSN